MSVHEKDSEELENRPKQGNFLSNLFRRAKPQEKEQQPDDDSGRRSELPDLDSAPEQEKPAEQASPAAFELTKAPSSLSEYRQRWTEEKRRSDSAVLVKHYLGDAPPEESLLRRVFTEVESRAKISLVQFERAQKRYLELQKKQEAAAKEAGSDSVQPAEAPAPPVLNGEAIVSCAPDWSAAWCMVLPPLGGGAAITEEDLRERILKKGIQFGVLEDNIPRLLAEDGCFVLTPIARGIPAMNGENGSVVDYFPRTVGTPQLIENDQGIVDFKDLHWLTPIEEGAVICDIIKQTKGSEGTDIRNQPIRAKEGKQPQIPMGDNVGPNKEGTSLVAKVSGHITFKQGKFHVANVLIIPGDVDLSTGNLEVKSDLVIHGNVLAGFSVRASGNVTIQGLVEGAVISADGNIIVNKGMNGNLVGLLMAGGDVYCKYLENTRIQAGGDVYIDSVVNCEINCNGRVHAKTGRGVVIGGTLTAMKGVDAKIIGNKAGRVTVVSIGPTDHFLTEKNKVASELEAVERELQQQALNPSTNLGATVLQMKKKKLTKDAEDLEALEELIAQGQILADVVYPITQVSIQGAARTVMESHSQCRIYLDQQEKSVKIGMK